MKIFVINEGPIFYKMQPLPLRQSTYHSESSFLKKKDFYRKWKLKIVLFWKWKIVLFFFCVHNFFGSVLFLCRNLQMYALNIIQKKLKSTKNLNNTIQYYYILDMIWQTERELLVMLIISIFYRLNVIILLYLRNSLLEQKESFVTEVNSTGKHKHTKVQVKLSKIKLIRQ